MIVIVHFNSFNDDEVEVEFINYIQFRRENVEDEVHVGSENVNDDNQNFDDDDTDYIGTEDELDSFSDTKYEHSGEIDDLD